MVKRADSKTELGVFIRVVSRVAQGVIVSHYGHKNLK